MDSLKETSEKGGGERERERERERQRQRQRQTETVRDRDRDRQTVSKLVFYAQSTSAVISGRTLRQTDRQTDRGGETETDRDGPKKQETEWSLIMITGSAVLLSKASRRTPTRQYDSNYSRQCRYVHVLHARHCKATDSK